MAIKDAFIAELKHESSLTKKMLERVSFDQKEWKPHEKSMTLGDWPPILQRYRIGPRYRSY